MMPEMPEPGTHAWEAWVNEVRRAALVAQLKAKQQRVAVPPTEVRDAARARGSKVAQLEARYRQLRIRQRGPERHCE